MADPAGPPPGEAAADALTAAIEALHDIVKREQRLHPCRVKPDGCGECAEDIALQALRYIAGENWPAVLGAARAPGGGAPDGYTLADAVRNLPIPGMADPLLMEIYDAALSAASDFVARAASPSGATPSEEATNG